MLRLSGITKDYKVADTKVRALRGLNLSFRKNEFVSILGPSGCGKTTLLNIIGGLDKATTGDLLIGGVSTKKFKDKDWDVACLIFSVLHNQLPTDDNLLSETNCKFRSLQF